MGRDSYGRSRSPTTGWWQQLDAGGVDADVVGGPADAEVVAAGGELPDEVGEVAVVGVAAGFGAQDGDGVVGDGVPFAEERRGPRVEEDEPGVVGGRRRGPQTGANRARPSALAVDDVEAPVQDHGGRGVHRVDQPLDGRADPLRWRRTSRRRARVGVPAVRSRSSRWARSASSSCRAWAMPSMTLSETPVASPRSRRT